MIGITIGVAALTLALMEPWAEWVHRRVWHGVLWRMHRSHHHKRHDRLELNDVLSVAHAPVAMAAIFSGIALEGTAGGAALLGLGLGMTAFGAAYVAVHDGFVHGRLPVGFLERSAYFRRVRDAHLVHHRGDHGPYGLFWPIHPEGNCTGGGRTFRSGQGAGLSRAP